MKNKVVLVGPCIGEMYWEFARFAPHVIWKKTYEYSNIPFIVLTRPDMFDVYISCASTLVPLNIPGDGSRYKANCFRLDDFPMDAYNYIVDAFKKQYSSFQIVDFIKPDISKKNFLNKNQFPKDKLLFKYRTRVENSLVLDDALDNRPYVILAPRYREGLKRNWSHWQSLYNMNFDNKDLIQKYNFVICGKKPDYVPDKYNRFFDINSICNTKTSVIGITIESIKRAKLTIGSQSAIPNISLLFKVPVIEWGHQKYLHTVEYNPFKTKVTFIEDIDYNIKPEKVYNEILKLL